MTANELIYLLVGAGLALGGQLVLQLRIVPRVEARKRREDRWERGVRELGEVLTDELPDRASAAEFELTEAVEELIGNPPPRNPWWLRHRCDALAAWSKKQLQAKNEKAVARETDEEA